MRTTIILLLLLSFSSAFSQSGLHKKADRKFKHFEFASAAKLYEKIVHKNPNDESARTRLDQCYNALNYQTMKVHHAIQRKTELNNGITTESNLPTKQH